MFAIHVHFYECISVVLLLSDLILSDPLPSPLPSPSPSPLPFLLPLPLSCLHNILSTKFAFLYLPHFRVMICLVFANTRATYLWNAGVQTNRPQPSP
jgi:hypothetical protein